MTESRNSIICRAKSGSSSNLRLRSKKSTFPASHINAWRCNMPHPLVSTTPKYVDTSPKIPFFPSTGRISASRMPLQTLLKKMVIAAGFIVAARAKSCRRPAKHVTRKCDTGKPNHQKVVQRIDCEPPSTPTEFDKICSNKPAHLFFLGKRIRYPRCNRLYCSTKYLNGRICSRSSRT